MANLLDILSSIRPEADFQQSGNFIEDGLLDSFDMVTLVTELDKAYSISIDGIDIIPENFINLDSIRTLLKKKGVEE
jgi:methoxymalonate biosynthesis acyl carrier protein